MVLNVEFILVEKATKKQIYIEMYIFNSKLSCYRASGFTTSKYNIYLYLFIYISYILCTEHFRLLCTEMYLCSIFMFHALHPHFVFTSSGILFSKVSKLAYLVVFMFPDLPNL